jgi:hypothetical protein
MANTSKCFSLLLVIFLAASSLIMVKSASASIPTPSVPQFSLQTVDGGVQMTIQNQPIIPNGQDTANIFYNIRIKSHDSSDWVSTTVPDPSQGIRGYIGEINTSGSSVTFKDFGSINTLLGLSDGSHQIDFEVEAINGYLNATDLYIPPIGIDPNSTPVVIVNTSGWSGTQTVAIPGSSVSASASPSSTSSSTPAAPEFPPLAILPLFASTLCILIVWKLRKRELQGLAV